MEFREKTFMDCSLVPTVSNKPSNNPGETSLIGKNKRSSRKFSPLKVFSYTVDVITCKNICVQCQLCLL